MGINQFDLIIFDCDGVLVDSEPIIYRIFAETLTEFGFIITYEEVVQQFVGKSLAVCLEILQKSYGKSIPDNFVERCREKQVIALQQELQPIAGITEVLKQLRLPKCVASNSTHRHIHLVLKLTQLLQIFGGNIYSAHDVPRPKPFPDVYLYAAEQMKTKPENCVVIEDSVTGVEAGYAAGMTVFGYSQHSNGQVLAAAGAKIVFNDMRQLFQLLS
ncbi:HAD family hydrolase [Calothrix sp. NIES-4101]|nr:HAD family hydrolase [Calothrix sp. NIES-4101]